MLKILFFFNDLVTSRQPGEEREAVFQTAARPLCFYFENRWNWKTEKNKKSPDLELENRRHDGIWRGDSGPGGHPYPASVRQREARRLRARPESG